MLEKAKQSVDLYTRYFYKTHDFDSDIPIRRYAVQKAIVSQINYMINSGIESVDDVLPYQEMTIGRTRLVSNGSYNHSAQSQFNLSNDALNWLKSVGFGYAGVDYDR